MTHSVPFFDYPSVFNAYREEFLSTFENVASRGAFILQEELLRFEYSLADFTGSKFAIGVANATDALEMGFVAGGITKDDEIIICSHTMMATASAVHAAGGVPVPVEVGEDRCIDPDSIEAAITPRTRAICPTQLNGRTCDMDRLAYIADTYGLDIYEDSAQALGSKFNGKSAGTFGRTGCLSFYPAKVLGCFGDGGAILTSDEELYRKLMLMRDHGRSTDGDIEFWARNSRLDNLQAAFLNVQLSRFPKVIERRRNLASLYQLRLGHCSYLQLPPPPDNNSPHFDIYQNFEVLAENRDNLRIYLKEHGVGTLIQWGGRPVHQFTKLGFTQSLPRTDSFFNKCIMLPLNMSVTDDDINFVCDRILDFYTKCSSTR